MNAYQATVDYQQILEAVRAERDLAQTHVAALQKDCADLRAKLDDSERACAEKDSLLRAFRYSMDRAVPFPSLEKLNHALSSDAGRDYVPMADVRRAVQFADRYVAAEGEEYMKWLRDKHPNLFSK